ncbi:MAG: methyltransferase domain-containing protein [Anaerolineales bacterium]|nr:methyltransferase domain-containing protein [Anaerolineales bacterium]
MAKHENIQEYLNGKKLYGDDFTPAELKEWFEDELEAYANMGAKDRANYQYPYHVLNYQYGYRFLPDQKFPNILGFGSAYGDELKPILEKIDRITITEPSDVLRNQEINGHPITYVKPNFDGSLPFTDNYFDLITCFGVLHHIANINTVLGEFYRCLKPSGFILIREPIVSMGDWRKTRPGLTRRERGIPLPIFRQMIATIGFRVINEKKCMFSLTSRLRYFTNSEVYNSKGCLAIDQVLCQLFAWNNQYHASNVLAKLRPTSVFYILTKPANNPF